MRKKSLKKIVYVVVVNTAGPIEIEIERVANDVTRVRRVFTGYDIRNGRRVERFFSDDNEPYTLDEELHSLRLPRAYGTGGSCTRATADYVCLVCGVSRRVSTPTPHPGPHRRRGTG